MFGLQLNSRKQNRTTGGPLIELHGVVKEYSGVSSTVRALRGVNMQVLPGEFLVIMGRSGSGKTTLINMITGLDRVTSGQVWVNGTAVHKLGVEKASKWRGRTIGVVFQTFELIPTLSVLQNVMLPMDFAGRYSLVRQRERALDLLTKMEIAEHSSKLPSAVSGGQQQRVAIARAMANDPPILVADEPTGSLDSGTSEAVLDVFETLVAGGKTVLLVTHDRDIAQRADRVITLVDGEIME